MEWEGDGEGERAALEEEAGEASDLDFAEVGEAAAFLVKGELVTFTLATTSGVVIASGFFPF